MSIPPLDPETLLSSGRTLSPPRQEAVLVLGSGLLTHNMRAIDWRPGASAPSWATEFDAWIGEGLARRDAEKLLVYRDRAPGVALAHPTDGPLIVALGASIETSPEVAFPITGFTYGSFTKRSVQFG